MRIFLALLAYVIANIFALQATAAQLYSITDLGIDGEESVADVGINNAGLITISLNLTSFDVPNKIFLLDGDQLTQLPTLEGISHFIGGINDNGLLAGSSESSDGLSHSVLYKNGQIQDFGAIGPLGSGIGGTNSAGISVGSTLGQENPRAIIVNSMGDITILGTLGGDFSSASDINNSGQVVGISFTGAPFVAGPTDTPAQEAFLYENGQMVGLGTLGGHTSNAFGINDLGQVVGDSNLPNGEMHAFIYDAILGMQDIGTPGQQSFARDVNEQGIVIGAIEVNGGNWRAAIFDELAGPTLLQDLIPANSGWLRLNSATDINDLGQIVGTGVIDGQQHAFLLTPIPEPSTSLLLLLGAGSLLALQKRSFARR